MKTTRKFVAIAPVENEFFYFRSTARRVPTASADRICAALNEARVMLHPHEVWHVYDEDYDYDCIPSRLYIRGGHIWEVRVPVPSQIPLDFLSRS